MSDRKDYGPCQNAPLGCKGRCVSSKTPVCLNCYCRVRYAIKKGTAYVIQRKGKLNLWLGTLKAIPTENVRHFKRRAAR